jgi:hypothetical protein
MQDKAQVYSLKPAIRWTTKGIRDTKAVLTISRTIITISITLFVFQERDVFSTGYLASITITLNRFSTER